ncbi:MAG: hypothetical protein M1829_003390 [Trizodia sp. TS-e1964]|nr:MAG: hypothetical protein M1829_003390 [Trizodia sp. TS-e1964]
MSRRSHPGDIYEERDYYRSEERPGARREVDYEEIDVFRRREPDFLRPDYGRTDAGPLVLRARETETYTRPISMRERAPEREEIKIDIRERERERPRDDFVEYRTRPRERARDREVLREDIDIKRERSRGPARDTERELIKIDIREREREKPKEAPREVVRPIIREPPIHQEIITHHRHIDHGIEYAPSPRRPVTPTPPPPPVPRTLEDLEIKITRSGGEARSPRPRSPRPRHVDTYDDTIIYERALERRKARDTRSTRARSHSVAQRASYAGEEDEIREEAEYYNRRASERGFVGEALHGATRDWSIVDVPPGTKRIRMDGAGGGSQEITWQRYNGVRRSKFITESEEYEDVDSRLGRQELIKRRNYDDMWTEITKDLVVKEAIEEMGYEYEETDKTELTTLQEDVLELVEVSEDIRRERRDRIRQIQWERERLPERRVGRYEDERVYEREIIFESKRPRGYR